MAVRATAQPRGRRAFGYAVVALTVSAFVGTGAALARQEPTQSQRSFEVVARKYAFDPPRIEVDQNDLVKITLKSADIAHSFTIDDYRIAKRVNPGRPIAFEFRADKAGTFPFYCNLQIDDGCRQMRGELVVQPRR